MRVDYRRRLYDPFYDPWSVHGVNSRSGCFGATSDALYSVSRDFMRRDALGSDVVVVARGGTPAAAAFSDAALYSTGGPISSLISARDITILAAIDDRSFGEASSFAVAFGSSAYARASLARSNALERGVDWNPRPRLSVAHARRPSVRRVRVRELLV
tara:strand:- start:27152 stop:27625 length:474 start_codon:yes stop_codon:yes gene_type:complete